MLVKWRRKSPVVCVYKGLYACIKICILPSVSDKCSTSGEYTTFKMQDSIKEITEATCGNLEVKHGTFNLGSIFYADEPLNIPVLMRLLTH